MGAVSLVLAKAYPEMKLVIQDRKKTIDEAHKVRRFLYPEQRLTDDSVLGR